jgi:transposase
MLPFETSLAPSDRTARPGHSERVWHLPNRRFWRWVACLHNPIALQDTGTPVALPQSPSGATDRLFGRPTALPGRSSACSNVKLELTRFSGHLILWEKGVQMSKSRQPYAPEFRRQMVELVRGGRTPEALSREFEPTAQSIRNWVAQADLDEGLRSDGLTSAEHEEVRRLRRENRQLREEREILKKAAAWFAREAESIPKRSIDS